LILVFLNFKKDDFIKFKNLFLFPFVFNFIILLIIIIPQFVLHDKSGMFGYYVLPLNLGFSIFIFFIIRNIYDSLSVPLVLKRSFFILLIFVINSFFERDALPLASSFAKEGKTTNEFLATIVDKSKVNDSILIVLDVYESFEFAYSIDIYLKEVANRKNIYFYIIDRKLKNNFAILLEKVFSEV
jgi:hypothetical protein